MYFIHIRRYRGSPLYRSSHWNSRVQRSNRPFKCEGFDFEFWWAHRMYPSHTLKGSFSDASMSFRSHSLHSPSNLESTGCTAIWDFVILPANTFPPLIGLRFSLSPVTYTKQRTEKCYNEKQLQRKQSLFKCTCLNSILYQMQEVLSPSAVSLFEDSFKFEYNGQLGRSGRRRRDGKMQ